MTPYRCAYATILKLLQFLFCLFEKSSLRITHTNPAYRMARCLWSSTCGRQHFCYQRWEFIKENKKKRKKGKKDSTKKAIKKKKENKEENKNSTKKVIKEKRKFFSFFLCRFLGREHVFFLFFLTVIIFSFFFLIAFLVESVSSFIFFLVAFFVESEFSCFFFNKFLPQVISVYQIKMSSQYICMGTFNAMKNS